MLRAKGVGTAPARWRTCAYPGLSAGVTSLVTYGTGHESPAASDIDRRVPDNPAGHNFTIMALGPSCRCTWPTDFSPPVRHPVDPTVVIAIVLGVRLAFLGGLALRLQAGTRRHRDQLNVLALLVARLPAGVVLEADLSPAAGSQLRIRALSPRPGAS